jgi:hypothetical protein
VRSDSLGIWWDSEECCWRREEEYIGGEGGGGGGEEEKHRCTDFEQSRRKTRFDTLTAESRKEGRRRRFINCL